MKVVPSQQSGSVGVMNFLQNLLNSKNHAGGPALVSNVTYDAAIGVNATNGSFPTITEAIGAYCKFATNSTAYLQVDDPTSESYVAKIVHFFTKILYSIIAYLVTLEPLPAMYQRAMYLTLIWIPLILFDWHVVQKLAVIPILIISYDYVKVLGIHMGLCPTNPLQLSDFFSFNGWIRIMKDEIFVYLGVNHFTLMDVIGGFAVSYHFYNLERRSFWATLLFKVNLGLCYLLGPIGLGVYIVVFYIRYARYCRNYIFSIDRSCSYAKTSKATPDLLDFKPIRFTERLPRPIRTVIYIISGIVGIAGFLLFLVAYLLLIVFSLIYWNIYGETPAVLTPPNKYHIPETPSSATPSFVRNTTARLRIFLYQYQPTGIWLLFFGLPHFALQILLQFACFIELIPNAENPRPLVAALAYQFGDFAPFGDGFVVSDRLKVMELLGSKSIVKKPESLGWRISSTMREFSRLNTTILSSNDASFRPSGAIIVEWLHKFNPLTPDMINPSSPYYDPLFMQLTTLKLEDKASLVYVSFGQALFYTATNGQLLSRTEKDCYLDTVLNPSAFFPDWFNFLLGGGFFERQSLNSYYTLRAAFAKHSSSIATEAALKRADELNVSRAEALRLVCVSFILKSSINCYYRLRRFTPSPVRPLQRS